MHSFVFVSDFDGTLTEKDFYKIISDDYLKEEVAEMFKDWKNKKIKDVDYLGYVFKNIRRNEKEIDEDITKITIDPSAKEFIRNIKAAGGDFIVVSAGTTYYIEKAFKRQGIDGVEIYSNRGVFKDKGIYFDLDKTSEFYSDIYGIDKSKVVSKLKAKYHKVFYAGDSEPDLKAALIADVVFAKGSLVKLLKDNGKEFIQFNDFSEVWKEVERYLKEW